MILYHGTTKEAAKNIKKNGFSWNLIGSNWGSTYGNAIYFTNNYDNAKNYSKNNDKEGEILKVEIENINFLKLTKDYSPTDKNHIREIKSIIMFARIHSKKNCLINIHGDEYIFFNDFAYKLIL